VTFLRYNLVTSHAIRRVNKLRAATASSVASMPVSK
jgi:hypothetical protein